MVVHNFYVCWPRGSPAKTDAVLVINAHTVLTLAIPLEGLKSVAGRNLQFMECRHGVELIKFACGDFP